MRNRKWIFAAILLIGGPSLLPFSLEVISLIELLGFLGVWTIYSSYAEYLVNHPRFKRGLRLATSWDFQPQMLFSPSELKACPQLVFHMIPVQSVTVWTLNILFWGGLAWCYII
ncbi:hypothetical protein AB0559_004595 [Vibrio parahaemolyticus]|uniref:hypothetical protein n=1 Tax=Vibrio parahaemolyticus TaxID=670 RepID=UPI0011205734|nr:hypothetical protein [Vibrio parahaemolyticus]MBE4187052.1 hypothetical protein [Vibrio parahaemolyticus]MDG2663704.1 hypothetical protein [Vibrio parahaemolyticus]TOJ27254.1 hypothetical protein CGI41_23560 [Vibrio parahaemolyticus]TOJ75768.1 hypothetical protein CGI31_23585 [Vibrio parahaemolyticus]TOJ89965.1 hypothetical protein CGI29_23935 [Vibrio parahaemolyticus]